MPSTTLKAQQTDSLSFFAITLALLLGLQVINLEADANTEQYTTIAEVEAGQLLYKTGDYGQYQQAVLKESKADIAISGMVAQVKLTQTFTNTTNSWQEGVYVFPLPDDAAVYQMRLTIGERVVEGQIKEKQQAKKIYQQAVNSGKRAALVEQERPNMFTTSVANIAPKDTISVTLSYQQTIQYDHERFSLRFPMTITPRYIPGQPIAPTAAEEIVIDAGSGWGVPTHQVPDADRITPRVLPPNFSPEHIQNPMRLNVTLDAGMTLASIASPSHALQTTRNNSVYQIAPSNTVVPMDKDFILSWRPAPEATPKAALFAEKTLTPSNQLLENEQHVLLMLMPPQGSLKTQRVAREMIFVIDTSGSMGGTSIRQAKQALATTINRLAPQDRFNIVEFNSDFRVLYPQPVAADRKNIRQALSYIRSLKASGGTEMAPALQAALAEQDETPKGYIRQVVFMTDGSVGNEEALFQQIQRQLGNSRLFTVGIGSAPNSWFMRKAAEIGRGTHTWIGSTNEVAKKMSALFQKLESPLATDITLHWPEGLQVDMLPARVPDLYAGEPVIVSARIRGQAIEKELTITGRNGSHRWNKQLSLQNAAQSEGISRLWARTKIENLEDGKTRGEDSEQVRNKVLPLALKNQLVTAYTSFVAIDQTPARTTEALQKKNVIPNTTPAGQSPQLQAMKSHAWPQTANGTGFNLIAGLLALLAALILRYHSRRKRVLQA
ncbi:marine proteobacterial sortase target protein [Parendozoicomonas sp. Alg238-R29]|uniref:marine proteobacterial sortase target protein n=1 Tax=Parendozoicomonas sp. Alg238-R29 TaxID=2993446 RepID=UPI00248EC6E4|nr:marine proteobacterial sortase target protein [Parendozoicomonas sp. Alg238-R29]